MGYPAWPDLTGLTGERDEPKYAQKAHFVRHGAEEWPSGTLTDGRQETMTPYELKTGSVIPATMISGINSDLPGQILAQVSEDVYDTATGRHLLIPQGSKVVGTHDNEVAFAQNRALVIWTRLIFPDASQVELEGMPGADSLRSRECQAQTRGPSSCSRRWQTDPRNSPRERRNTCRTSNCRRRWGADAT